jgi:toxin YoeB
VNVLIEDCLRGDATDGIGKPEPLRHDLSGYWSRRINHEHRLVYSVTDSTVIIISARHHY